MDKRNTVQKEIVFQAVRKLGNHATADEIFALVNSEYPSVSRGTVYRNLGVLAEEGKISKVEIPSEADHYDHVTDCHYHVICVKCGRVFDVDIDILPDLTEKIKDKRGFDYIGYSLVFRGICPECKEKEN